MATPSVYGAGEGLSLNVLRNVCYNMRYIAAFKNAAFGNKANNYSANGSIWFTSFDNPLNNPWSATRRGGYAAVQVQFNRRGGDALWCWRLFMKELSFMVYKNIYMHCEQMFLLSWQTFYQFRGKRVLTEFCYLQWICIISTLSSIMYLFFKKRKNLCNNAYYLNLNRWESEILVNIALLIFFGGAIMTEIQWTFTESQGLSLIRVYVVTVWYFRFFKVFYRSKYLCF